MLVKEQVQSVISPRPQSFAALMEMYEMNYIQLRLLLGDLRSLSDEQAGVSQGHLPLLISVKERSRYTMTLLLTYHFLDGEGKLQETRPDLLVRIYHDSLQVEVVTHKCKFTDQRTRFWWQKNDSMLLCRWRMNRFLFKWLRYLHRQDYQLGGLL